MSVVSISAHAWLHGHVDAHETAAAAAEELQNPESEDHGSVLLVGPVVSGYVVNARACEAARGRAKGAELALGSESVDSDGDPGAEVSAAEAGHAAAGDASKHRLVDTDANTNSGQHDSKKDSSHAGVDVRPAGASFLAVLVTVVLKVLLET